MNLGKQIRENQKLYHISRNVVAKKPDRQEEQLDNERKSKKRMRKVAFMAFATGQTQQEFKRYWGVAPVTVVAVNPNAKELTAIYNHEQGNEPEYKSTAVIDDKEYPTMRLDFIVRTDKNKVGVDKLYHVVFNLTKKYVTNADRTKVHVIDKYGQTCWLTNDEFKARAVPNYANGPANIDAASYRPLYRGEEQLTLFIRKHRGVEDARIWNANEKRFMTNPDLDKSIGIIDDMEKIFAGDISEIRNLINEKINNKVKVMCGFRLRPDGKQIPVVYTEAFCSGLARPNRTTGQYYDFVRSMNDNMGRLNSHEYLAEDFREYNVEPDAITSPSSIAMPDINSDEDIVFGPSDNDKLPWE